MAWERLCAMADSAAALVDERLRPPRQGDSDEGRALLLDAPVANRWPSLLTLADELVGRLDWWPRPPADAGSPIIDALAGTRHSIRQARPAAIAIRRRRDDIAAHDRRKTRSGAGATAARTDISASPLTPTPTPCR